MIHFLCVMTSWIVVRRYSSCVLWRIESWWDDTLHVCYDELNRGEMIHFLCVMTNWIVVRRYTSCVLWRVIMVVRRYTSCVLWRVIMVVRRYTSGVLRWIESWWDDTLLVCYDELNRGETIHFLCVKMSWIVVRLYTSCVLRWVESWWDDTLLVC